MYHSLYKIIVVSLFWCTLITPASAWFRGAAADDTIKTLRVGGGGQLTSIDIQCDQGVGQCNNSGTTTKVIRTDTYGAYVWRTNGTCDINIPSPCWQQVVSVNSLPSGDPIAAFNACANGKYCAPYEIRIAPSNTNVAYMYLRDSLYRTSNLNTSGTVTWVKTAFASATATPEGNTKFFGPFLAIDPQNANAIVVGTPSGNAFYTIDGGTTFNTITLGSACTITTVGTQGGGYNFAYDLNSSVSGGLTQGIYLSCYGTGVYYSSTGPSGTFSLLNSAGMPTLPKQIKTSPAGLLYVIATNNVYLYTAGAWTNILDGTAKTIASASIAIDPNNQTHLLVAGGASTPGFYYATDSATSPTWGNRISAKTRTANDVPWLANTNTGTSVADVNFDPSQTNTVVIADGIGMWTIVPNLLGNCGNYCYAWTSITAGIEQLVTNWMISPPGGNPIGSAWDRALWTFTNLNVYPSNHGPDYAQTILHGWSTDYAPNSSYIFDFSYGGSSANNPTGYSTNGGGDGGPPSEDWTTFTAQPSPQAFPGDIAALSTTNVAILTNQSGLVGKIFISTDGGVTWPQMTACAGVPSTGASGWGSNLGDDTNRHNLTADKTGNNYYAFNYSTQPGVYKISADGLTCTRMTTTHFDASSADGYAVMMRTVPGVAGHLFFTAGPQDPDNANQSFWHCVDTGTMTCSSSSSYVSGVTDVWAFGFGATKSGDTYPAIYLYGRVAGDPGLWRGTNLSTTPVWTKLSHYAVGGWLDGVRNVQGDMTTYGKVYVGFQGSSWKYGQFN